MTKTKYFWKCTGVRALKTMAQVGIAAIGSAAVLQQVNWMVWISTVALSGLLSVLTSLAGLPEVKSQEGSEV